MQELTFPKGLIIAFEGLDCSFKETNFNHYKDRLIQKFIYQNEDLRNTYKVYHESFPRYGRIGCHFVKQWLQGRYNRSFLMKNPEIVDTFYSLDRFDYWYEICYTEEGGIAKDANITNYIDINANNCFVFDRYTLSNALYNPINLNHRVSLEDMVFDYNNFKIPQPDICVWMRVKDFGFIEETLSKKAHRDRNELNLDYLREVWKRSESLINYRKHTDRNLFAVAGIDPIVIDTIDDNNKIKTEEELSDEVTLKINDAVNKRLNNKTLIERRKIEYASYCR